MNSEHAAFRKWVNHGESLALKHVKTPLTKGQHLRVAGPLCRV